MAFPINHCALISLTVLLYNLRYLQFGLAADTMLPSQGISVGETLTSRGQIFELGFFNPLNSSRRYVGIWCKKVPETILWVANRDNPLSASDQSVRFILNVDGNLRLLDGKQRMVWSTNLSVRSNSSIAVLSDNGDFMLKDSASGQIAWDSFQHICDVFLYATPIQISTKMGAKPFMYSWSSADDPSPGNFTLGFDPETPVQLYMWKGSAIRYRSGPWNGMRFVGVPEMSTAYIHTFSIHEDRQAGILYFSSNHNDDNDSYIGIVKLFPDGFLKVLKLQGTELRPTATHPNTQCDVYGTCGPFGVCNPNDSPICSCLKGFIPKSPEKWSKGNWTDGCMRRTELLCSKNVSRNLTLVKSESDGFQKLSMMKLPDIYRLLDSEDGYQGCKDWCLSNCSCSAFAYVNGIGCLVWTADLLDLQKFSSTGEDLFVRLAHSELVETNHRTLVIILVSSLVIVIVALLTYARWRCRAKKNAESYVASENNLKHADISELPTYDFEKILAATNGFSVTNKIGEGGFGPVYKGKLQDGQEIAVKRLLSHAGQGVNEFRNEILLISKLQHRNLVKILGSSIKGEEKLIVYEYLTNRSLDTYLFDPTKKKQLNWALRFNITQSVARGLSYLHRDSRLKVIHRDMKASNILLDHDMNPKISDFGLARTFQATQESANTLRVVGTYGYISPEYAMRGIFSEKSDVFSFGVLILEIVSGKRNTSFSYYDQDLSLITYAWRLWNEGRGLEMMDESMLELYSDTEVLRCINVGLLCVQDHADDRPTMSNVVLMLSSETPLPSPKKPVFVPQNQSPPTDREGIYSVNEVTVSQIEGR